MSMEILTQDQKDIIDMLKSLGTDIKTIISAMPMVEDSERAKKVILKLIELDNKGEKMTSQKLLKIMATIFYYLKRLFIVFIDILLNLCYKDRREGELSSHKF